MIKAFEATIARENRKLSQMIKGAVYTPKFLCPSYYDDDRVLRDCQCGHCDDGITVIPVKVKLKSGTTIELEDGILVDCDHEGAELEEVDLEDMVFDTDYGNFLPVTHKVTMHVCDGCGENSLDGEEW